MFDARLQVILPTNPILHHAHRRLQWTPNGEGDVVLCAPHSAMILRRIVPSLLLNPDDKNPIDVSGKLRFAEATRIYGMQGLPKSGHRERNVEKPYS